MKFDIISLSKHECDSGSKYYKMNTIFLEGQGLRYLPLNNISLIYLPGRLLHIFGLQVFNREISVPV